MRCVPRNIWSFLLGHIGKETYKFFVSYDEKSDQVNLDVPTGNDRPLP